MICQALVKIIDRAEGSFWARAKYKEETRYSSLVVWESPYACANITRSDVRTMDSCFGLDRFCQHVVTDTYRMWDFANLRATRKLKPTNAVIWLEQHSGYPAYVTRA